MATKKEYDADEVGVLKIQQIPKKRFMPVMLAISFLGLKRHVK
jgi:hypothetical protein